MPEERVSIFIRAKDFASRVLGRTNRTLKQLGISARGLATAFGAVAATATGFAFLGKKIFDVGASVIETRSKFDTVFGAATERVRGFAKEFGSLAGLSGRVAEDLLATTGAIAQGFGFAQAASADFAQQILRTAADLGSFNNLPTEDVVRRITSALAGSMESLDRLGIVIRKTNVQQQALTETGKTNVKQLNQQEEATALLTLITQKAGVAMGDLARTQDSAANRAKRLKAQFQTIIQDFSVRLLPTLATMLPLVEDLATAFSNLAPKVAEFVRTFVGAIGLIDPVVESLRTNMALLGTDIEGLTKAETNLASQIDRANESIQQETDRLAALRTESNFFQRLTPDFLHKQETIQKRINELEEDRNAMLIVREDIERRLLVLQRTERATVEPAPGVSLPTPLPAVRGLSPVALVRAQQEIDRKRQLVATTQPRFDPFEVTPEFRKNVRETRREMERLAKALGETKVGADQLAVGLLQAFSGLAQAITGGGGGRGIFSALLGGVSGIASIIGTPLLGAGIAAGGGLLSGLLFGKQRPLPVIVEDAGPNFRQALRENLGPDTVILQVLAQEGMSMADIEQVLRDRSRRDAVERIPTGIRLGG